MTPRFTGSVFLPHANSLHPQFPVSMIGGVLAEAFRDTIEAPLPEHLAEILRRLENQEARS